MFEAITARGDAAAAVTDAAWLQAMLDTEAALARALASAGVIDGADAEAIAEACVAERFDAAAIAAAASGSGNPVVPLKAALTEAVEGPAAAHVHRGATRPPPSPTPRGCRRCSMPRRRSRGHWRARA